jgi:hypothetical protein
VSDVLSILERNIDIRRVNESDEDDFEKYGLSLSIMNFLKCSSNQIMMQDHIDDIPDINQIFKRILQNEDLYSSSKVNTCPIDLENTWIARQIPVLMETFQDQDYIEPYSDVSLRILMRIGDILMFRHEMNFDVIKTEYENS